MPRGNEPLGPIASKLLFENERVKIWNLVIEPGGSCPWHLHERDYITVRLAGDPTTLELEDGTTMPGSSEVGQWQYHTDHEVHRILNHNDSEYKNILIELKD